jgi:hypothetical protein
VIDINCQPWAAIIIVIQWTLFWWEVTSSKQFQFARLLALNPHLFLRFILPVCQWKMTEILFVLYYIEEVVCSAPDVCSALLVSKEWEVTNDKQYELFTPETEHSDRNNLSLKELIDCLCLSVDNSSNFVARVHYTGNYKE